MNFESVNRHQAKTTLTNIITLALWLKHSAYDLEVGGSSLITDSAVIPQFILENTIFPQLTLNSRIERDERCFQRFLFDLKKYIRQETHSKFKMNILQVLPVTMNAE